jgi:predicted DCC family thiol-disulfide oxidoreductase YuxK
VDDPAKNILLFDGICNLCNGFVRFIIKRDSNLKFKFAALQSDRGQDWLEHFGLSGNNFDSFVLIQGNAYYVKSTAVLKMFKELGGIWRLFYIFILLPVPVRDFFYNLIAKSRFTIFGKRHECMIPTPELMERFL